VAAAARYTALALIMALSAVLNTNRLRQNGYANTFYSAGVKSMLHSLHNFLYVSFDPGGLITVDKPPLGLWVQVLSAKLFGFSPLSLLLPEAIMGVLAVAALYWAMARSLGPAAALAGALALAVFPSFVAVSRDNNVDALLILLMVLACGTALRAIEAGRMRWLIATAALVGLAFNTKTLAAFLVVPGIALGYFTCAPGSLARRGVQLLAAGLLLAVIALSWLSFVDLTPASKRPYVGGSTDNSELGLTFAYNGFGRLDGQSGGPGQVPVKAGAMVILPRSLVNSKTERSSTTRAGQRASAAHTVVELPPAPVPSRLLPDGRARQPTPFGGSIGVLRLFKAGLGGQGGWMVPFAFIGMITLALVLLAQSRWVRRLLGRGQADLATSQPEPSINGHGPPPRSTVRRDPRLASLLVLGGWFLLEALFMSFSKGIVHPYYVSAMGPGAAAMVGAGAVTFAELARTRSRLLVLVPLAVGATVAAQLVLMHRDGYMNWYPPVLIALATVGLVALLGLRKRSSVVMALLLGVLLLAPAAYATTTWGVPVEGTFPTAGPHAAGGLGGLGISHGNVKIDHELLAYIDSHHQGTRWSVLTVSSVTAAPLILLGSDAGSVGGYSGTDPALDGKGFARLVARKEARYVLLGGAYASRGGNGATVAVLKACREIPSSVWRKIRYINYFTLVLFDCAGDQRKLAAAP
jgi:4-amino-4-deoxy-L-arabinose transferase-like glycosyltransferase